MDPTLIAHLRDTPLHLLYLVAIIYLWRQNNTLSARYEAKYESLLERAVQGLTSFGERLDALAEYVKDQD